MPDTKEDDPYQHAAGARQSGADEKGDQNHLIDIDSHHLSGVEIHGNGAHGPSQTGAGDEVGKGEHKD